MASFCSAGDIARVTFPDGTIQDFSDTPISVECNQLDCTIYQYRVLVGRNGYPDFTVNYSARTPNPRYTWDLVSLYVWEQVCSNGVPTSERRVTLAGSYFPSAPTLTTTLLGSLANPSRRIKILGASGNQLFSGLFNNCNYSVECIQGCPDGSLDCGDCCLSCDDIFNEISSIRALVSRIK